MSVFKNEDEVIQALKDVWKDYHPYVTISLASYKFDETFEKWFKSKPPRLTHPEIDIITCQEQGRKIKAHEVKYFRIDKKGINYSFYEGLGEALSLLRFGFDDVALVHVFDKEVPIQLIEKYALNMEELLKESNLPIHYDYYIVKSDRSFDKQFLHSVEATRYNPFLSNETTKKIINLIRSLLRIPTPP